MPRIILLLVLLFAAWYVWRYIQSLDPQQRSKIIRSWGLIALVVVSLILVATGRMHWVGAAIAAAIPILRVLGGTLFKAMPLLRMWHSRTGKPSVIKTRGLAVSINFATGETTGEVFEGPFQGKPLADLNEDQLREQLAFFQQQDRQSALLLQAYLLRRGFSTGTSQQQQPPPATTDLDDNEALLILGLEPGASREDIIRAHRSLIQKLHPDRGGNDYLAAKINAAKETLIKKAV